MRIHRRALGDVVGIFPGSTTPGDYKDLSQVLNQAVSDLTQNPLSSGYTCVDDIVASLARLADPTETPCNLVSVGGSGPADPNCANPSALVSQAQAALRSALLAKGVQLQAQYPGATLSDLSPYLPCGTTSLPSTNPSPANGGASTVTTPIPVISPTSPQTPGIPSSAVNSELPASVSNPSGFAAWLNSLIGNTATVQVTASAQPTSWFEQSMIGGIPNWALAIAAVGAVWMFSKK